jgi:hypothetical protein
MNEKAGMALYTEQEKALGREVTDIEKQADALRITDGAGFEQAADFLKRIKSTIKRVDEYWEPLRVPAYEAYKAVTDHKKAMTDPLKNSEAILKKKMSAYQVEQERIRREEEERIRRLAQEEMERKLAEAEKAEEAGNEFEKEFAMVQAEILENTARTATVALPKATASGIAQKKGWEIKNIDLSKLPCEFAGVVIRPADEKAIMQLIKATKGQVKIPGVEYEETVNIAVRAS